MSISRQIALDEYVRRTRQLAAELREAGLDGVLLSAETNIDYFSGYRHHAPWTLFARPFFQLITADAKALLLGHSFLTPEMARTAAVGDIRAYQRSGEGIEAVADCLHELGLTGGKLGMEFGAEQRLGITQQELETLRANLPSTVLVDAADLLWRLRMVKSPAEQALMQKSAAITAAAMATGFDRAAAGTNERDIARALGETMMREGADRPGFIMMASGVENHHVLSGKPTDRALQPGDMLWMDLGTVYDGYWSDFCRAGIVGEPTAKQRDCQSVILAVNEACLDAVIPGRPISDIAIAAERAFSKCGLSVEVGTGRIGHGMGLMSTEPPHVAHYDKTLMTPGLVFTIEPRFINEHGIFNCEELVLVTETGGALLTDAPRELRAIS